MTFVVPARHCAGSSCFVVQLKQQNKSGYEMMSGGNWKDTLCSSKLCRIACIVLEQFLLAMGYKSPNRSLALSLNNMYLLMLRHSASLRVWHHVCKTGFWQVTSHNWYRTTLQSRSTLRLNLTAINFAWLEVTGSA